RVGVGASVGVGSATEGQVAAEVDAADARRRAGGGVGVAVVGDAVGRDLDDRVGLGDAVGDRAAGILVVAGGVGEGPRVGVGASVGVSSATEGQVAAEVDAAHARGRAGGGVGVAVVGDAVGRDHDRCVGLGDGVVDRAAGVAVVAGGVGEGPRVGVGAGIGVGRAGEVQIADEVDAAHARGRAGGGVGVAVVGDAVGRDHDRCVGLGDGVVDRAAGVAVVAGRVGEGPGVRVRAGVGVGSATEGQVAAEVDAADARGRAGVGVAVAVVGDAVGRDHDRCVGLGDGVVDRAAGVAVVAGRVGEGPGVRVRAGVGVGRAGEVQIADEVDAAHARGRAGGGVAVAVVGDAVGRNHDHRVGLGDGVVDRAAGAAV